MVFVEIQNAALADALRARFDLPTYAHTNPGPTLGDLLITTTSDLSVDECRQRARGGANIIVLASVGRPEIEVAYLAAGAHQVIEMQLRGNALSRLGTAVDAHR